MDNSSTSNILSKVMANNRCTVNNRCMASSRCMASNRCTADLNDKGWEQVERPPLVSVVVCLEE
mgnify:CR=1 FL=1